MCLNPGDILHDRYQIIDELGRGGFATTYRARDLDIPEELICVVKEIQPPCSNDPSVLQRARERFDNEVRALLRLGEYDRIPRLLASFQERTCSQGGENFYLILEYIEGNPLNQEITQNTRWVQQQVIEFLQDILPVIEFVNQNNVIHRDIKPSNLIRRSSDNRIVLIDFGAVKEISTLDNPELERTRTVNIGTCGYMAPEQFYGCPRGCSDIYSIGIICIQALTGLSPREFLPYILNNTWRSIPDRPIVLSNRLTAILNRMVCYDPDRRYENVAEILRDIDYVPPEDWLLKLFKLLFKSNFRWLLLGTIGILTGCTIAIFGHKILTPKTCSLVQGDSLSCGEEALLKYSTPRLKQRGVDEFAKSNYREAFNFFKRSWNQELRKDPETLIYMNNALLKAKKIEYYTIAIAIPVKKNAEEQFDINLAKEILRGVAQAQTEFNLKLLNSELDSNLAGLDIQKEQTIKGKGLQVIIADDANVKEESIARANSLIKIPNILGVIGHYTNKITTSTVDIYNQNNLVLISSGSTTEEITENPRKFFFRTVPSTKVSVEVFVKYLIEQQSQTKIAGFYNPASESTSSFWEEFQRQFKERRGSVANISEFDLAKNNFDVKKAIEEVGENRKTTIVLNPSHDGKSLENAIALFKANLDRNWVVGTGGMYGPKTLEAASELPSFKKFAVATSWHPLNSPNSKFPADTRKLWVGNVSHRTALTYDAAKTLIQAIEMQPQPTREGMQKTIANLNFSASGATGTIQFEPTGDRKNFQPKLVHIVKCANQQFGVTFVPIEFPTATAAGLKCK
ncbi:MAG: ABC transporter substrate-binding protein [Richelia sp. CSU_2_1]|nr:ABC transporter substrate-binding protein [Richelia sp. CSU_2_1]